MSLTLMRNTGAIVDPNGRLVVRIVYADDAMARVLLAAASAEWERRHPPDAVDAPAPVGEDDGRCRS